MNSATNFNLNKLTFKEYVMDFLFPIRIDQSMSTKVRVLTIIGIMITLKLILGLFSIPLAPTLVISVSWVPLEILGWYLGPVIGLPISILADTLSWAISGAVWFWMYAIQQPLKTFISSVLGFIYRHRCKKNFAIDFIFLQLIILLFGIITAYYMFTATKSITSKFAWSLKVGVIVALIVFLLTIELLLFILVFGKKYDNLILFIYVSISAILSSFIFSFILGTISAVGYYRYITHGAISPNYEKYGYLFYLFPRLIKETFRVPFLIVTVFTIQRLICLQWFDQLRESSRIYW